MTRSFVCTQCGGTITADEAPRRGLICIPCRRANGRNHYRANRDYYVAKAKRRGAQLRAEIQAWILDYLRCHPCIDCGVRDIRVLEFDHRNPDDKVMPVSKLATLGWSLATVQREVSKCDVRCANCHRIKTVEELAWWRSREGLE